MASFCTKWLHIGAALKVALLRRPQNEAAFKLKLFNAAKRPQLGPFFPCMISY